MNVGCSNGMGISHAHYVILTAPTYMIGNRPTQQKVDQYTINPHIAAMQGAKPMLKFADQAANDTRAPRLAKPRQKIDRKKLRAEINKQFSKTLEYLAK